MLNKTNLHLIPSSGELKLVSLLTCIWYQGVDVIFLVISKEREHGGDNHCSLALSKFVHFLFNFCSIPTMSKDKLSSTGAGAGPRADLGGTLSVAVNFRHGQGTLVTQSSVAEEARGPEDEPGSEEAAAEGGGGGGASHVGGGGASRDRSCLGGAFPEGGACRGGGRGDRERSLPTRGTEGRERRAVRGPGRTSASFSPAASDEPLPPSSP